MEKMYDDIEHATSSPSSGGVDSIMLSWQSRWRTTRDIGSHRKVDNLIKVTENVYYARVYATALKVLRSNSGAKV